MLPGQFKQGECTKDVGFNEGIGLCDGSVNMGFGGEMADRIDVIGVEHIAHGLPVADIGFDKDVAIRICIDAGQILRVSGIGQAIHVDHPAAETGLRKQVADKIGSDESTSAGDQYVFHNLPWDFELYGLGGYEKWVNKSIEPIDFKMICY